MKPYHELEGARDVLKRHGNGACACVWCASAREAIDKGGWKFSPEGWNGGLAWNVPSPDGHCKGIRCDVIDGPCRCRCDDCDRAEAAEEPSKEP